MPPSPIRSYSAPCHQLLLCWVSWVFSETFRINLSFLQHILTDALLGKGRRGGGPYLQGLPVGADALTLVALVHLVRVTAWRVTISNEIRSRRCQCMGDLYWKKCMWNYVLTGVLLGVPLHGPHDAGLVTPPQQVCCCEDQLWA